MSDQEKKKPKAQGPVRMNIKVDGDMAKGSYSNVTLIHNKDGEFVFDFVFAEPQRPQGHVVSRVIMNAKSAKKMSLGLNEMIKKHEERSGIIELPGAEPPKSTYH